MLAKDLARRAVDDAARWGAAPVHSLGDVPRHADCDGYEVWARRSHRLSCPGWHRSSGRAADAVPREGRVSTVARLLKQADDDS